ncbi:type IV secretory system conjugative DNA transfer family protein [Flagellimonas meridianipacifica]|uniref:Type IV secretion system coupling TraD/TrwB family protein n=1 Tax=Flagellimonas meridianipacifica TaxID=1080225 RepID=A0A2T0M906_9FLAO|nr:type IV secretory system conjugative DNA transfer family protein [Allomuricauda pacifica]PRX53953.1 type IV secretion system coupling TraD/TrwB family protein [Allomuricauda pacifica]
MVAIELHIIGILLGLALVFWSTHKLFRYAFGINMLLILSLIWAEIQLGRYHFGISRILLLLGCPLMLLNTVLYVFLSKENGGTSKKRPFYVQLKTTKQPVHLENIRRGISIIGSAGSGKTESVVYGLLQHFAKHQFCGVIHDYKDFEITEMAYPLFHKAGIDVYTIAFDQIYQRVNPIAPKYLPNEESVNEVARVLIENLLEQKESGAFGTSKFFNDAAEGLIAGLIWKLRSKYKKYCTLPHLIAIYQLLDTDSLIAFLSSDQIAKAMASAFIGGKDSDRQTAGVKSTLANALKKISSKQLFMALSADEVPLNINGLDKPMVVSVVNNPKYETAYSPTIAAIIHTITKQMSVRGKKHSFLMMEEAPTIRLLNMHRIPATLRSYDICTVYVMQDKVQNDMMYGDKASRAILSNLSYQFFGKVNDPDTAKYYERFFEIIKRETTSINRSHNLNFDTRITTGEREVSKNRAAIFFKLKQGEFITYADGMDKKVQFKTPKILKARPVPQEKYSEQDILENYERIFEEARSIFK